MTRTTKAELLDLAARTEAAQGADAALDRDIAHSLGWARCDDRKWWQPKHVEECRRAKVSKWRYFPVDLPTYTANLDAALTLVPNGWRWIVDGDGNATCLPCGMRGNPVEHIYAATPALALTTAALRARAEEADE